MKNETVLAITYDKFRDFVKKKLRVKPNENIDTRSFEDLDKAKHGPTHMCINLENVVQGNKELFNKVTEFHKDASILQYEKVEDVGSNFLAWVPYIENHNNHNYNHNNNSKYKKRSKQKLYGEPNVLFLFLYVFVLFVVIFLAILKTNRSDWNFIF